MSNPLAIAAVTAALRRRLADNLLAGVPAALPPEFDINSARVTVSPPDRARADNKKVNQVNLHLYRVEPSAALRNHDFGPPLGGGPGPLALVLHYLVSAYASGDDETPAHVMLAQALRIVHERPFLAPAELRAALPGSDAALDVEAVRLTLVSLGVEEYNRLWSLYQTPARLSAAFSASLVLIEPRTAKSAPLPVLTRALDVRPDTFQYPTIDAIEPPQRRPFALLGDTLTIRGQRLAAAQVRVRLAHPRLALPIDLTPGPGSSATALRVALPADPKALPAGPYALSVRLLDGASERTTDVHTLEVAPNITAGLPADVARAPDRSVTLTLGIAPEVRQGQRLALLFGDREVAPPPPTPPPPGPPQPPPASFASQQFVIPNVAPGTYLVRLRVDGVDSDLLDRAAATPTFAADRRISVT